jgi:hypothetical protein
MRHVSLANRDLSPGILHEKACSIILFKIQGVFYILKGLNLFMHVNQTLVKWACMLEAFFFFLPPPFPADRSAFPRLKHTVQHLR